ncbi:MAG TPA: ATP-dependent helicase [bacterium (Candidatus Stahlbacteria)]|nr:ATP-dependent helicase [Candidatus Stahlbacteria bacterium]
MTDKMILEEIINKPKQLSNEQKKAVISKKKYIRVVAGAGTGKTETLTRRIIYLLLYEKVEPKEIVAFTFTEKAAQSMKSRIYERVRQLRGEEACAKLGEMYVGTIHGYCLRILEDYFGYGDYDVLDENQEMAFILREGWGLGLNVGGKYAENCKDFIKSINVAYDELLNRKKLKKEDPDFHRHLERYESILDNHRLLTFGRMVALAVQKLIDHPKKLSHIKHLLVDEYQDINRTQEKLIKVIGRKAKIFIVGDPRQSIYQWRGSDEKCFEDFITHFKNVDLVTIKENRRSGKNIVKLANTFADTFSRARYKHIRAIRKGKGVAIKAEFETPEDEAEWVISQIEKYVNSGRCNYGDCAILLRSVTTSAEPFINLLRSRNIPYLVGGKVGLFRRDEGQALGRLFSWLWDDGFWVEDPWRWWDQTRGEELLETGIEAWNNATGIPISPGRKKKLKDWKNKVETSQFDNFTQIFHGLLIILRYKDLDFEDRLHATVMANLGRFSTLLADYEASVRLGGNKPDWVNAVKGLCWYMNTYASGAYEEQPSEDIRGIDAVQIMTIHQAKGLEWPIVFIPAMVDRRFPSSKIGSEQNWYVPRDMFDVNRYEGEIDDERRLFYVAITRAKDIVCISYFKRINNRRRRSQFIDEIEGVVDTISPDMEIPSVKITPPTLDEEIQTFSAGEILTYLKCPYFYRLREIWHYKPGLVEALGYGKSLHYCLRYASELIENGMKPEVAIEKAVDEKFHVPYAGGRMKENMRKRAKKVLTRFVKKHKDDMGKIEEIEARLEFPVQKATITGRVDVILKDKNTMEVRDYKTSDEVTTFEQASLQIQLYTQGLRMIGKPISQASLAYLENAELKEVSIKKDDLRKAKKIAEKCIEGIMKSQFEPKPENGYCKYCDQREICKWRK